MDLEMVVFKLRYHVSVLSKRNHVLMKEKEMEKEEEEASTEVPVAFPVRSQEPEPQVVARPLMRMSGIFVADGELEEDVWVVIVAPPSVAESRVAKEVHEPEVVVVRLPKGKRRRIGMSGREVEERQRRVRLL